MKRIFLGLIVSGVVFGQADHRLSLNGSLGFGVRYIDINKDVKEWPKDLSYLMELSSVGNLDKNGVGGILSLSYDKLNKAEIKNVSISLELANSKLEGGDVLLDISDFTIKNSTIRGIKGDFQNKVLCAYGVSKEKIEPGSLTFGQYRQWLGVARFSTFFRNNTFGITYLYGEDDPNSVAILNGKPIMNKVVSGDVVIPLASALSFKSDFAFSDYDENKSDRKEPYKEKAFLGGFFLNFTKLSLEGLYQYIEPNFYTAGNTSLKTDWEGIKLNAKYVPSNKPIISEINLVRYNNNPKKNKTNPIKTNEFEIKSEITPKQFPALSIDHKTTKERDNHYSPLKIGRELSLGLSTAIKNIDVSLDYNRSSSDHQKDDTYDSLLSSYSLNTTGALTKGVSLFLSSSFITSKIGKTPEIKQDSSSYLLSFSFRPIQSLRIAPSYDYSKTEEESSLILKEHTISLSFDYYLSTKYQINMEYKNIDHKEETNTYKGSFLGLKTICLF